MAVWAAAFAGCLIAWPAVGQGGLLGQVTTLAGGNHHGHGDDFATQASFDGPRGLAVDAQGDLFVADYFNACVRMVTADGTVRTIAGAEAGFADGRGDAARFRQPTGLATGPGGQVYLADSGNHRIRRLSYDKFLRICLVTTLAGGSAGDDDGPGGQAQFDTPQGVAADAHGNVYVADTGNHRIRRLQADGTTTTLAGWSLGFADGQGRTASFARPEGLAVDAGGTLYVADTNNHAIRRISPDGRVVTLAGDGQPGFADGNGRQARFQEPNALAVDATGTLYVSDTGNAAIRRVTPDGTVTTLAGGHAGFADGRGHDARFLRPRGIGVGPQGALFVADMGNNRIRRVQ
jgi:sugar lactone lactonase YvrE